MLTLLAFGLVFYLVTGVILSNHCALGLKYYQNHRTRLIFFWIFPVLAVIAFIAWGFFLFIVDEMIFDQSSEDSGVKRILDIKF